MTQTGKLAMKAAEEIIRKIFDKTECELFPVTTETRVELAATIIERHFTDIVKERDDAIASLQHSMANSLPLPGGFKP